MDYYSEHEGRVYTEVELRLMGIPEGDVASALGLSPLRYVMPDYDAGLYTVEPDGDPFFDGQVYVQKIATVARPLEVARAEVKRRATAHRWAVETGGISVANYGRVLTSIEDQNRIATAIQGCTSANIQEVDFKGADGWVSITREMLTQISVLIAEHVQLCFTRERELHEAADACTDVSMLAAINIEADWPGQGA